MRSRQFHERARLRTRAIDRLEPMVDAQSAHVLSGRVLAMDETSLEAGREAKGKMRRGWLWPVYGSSDEVVFHGWLFASSEVGAQRVGIIQSLLVTCRLHEVDAYTYLVDVLQRISVHPAKRAIELTPRMWKSLFADAPMRSDLGARHHDPPPH